MKRVIIGLHFVLVVLAYTAWVWLDYRIVILGSILHLLMLEVLKGCPLSFAQFSGDKSKRFYEWWLPMLGVQITPKNRRAWRVFMQYILPVMIIVLALVLQEALHWKPFIAL